MQSTAPHGQMLRRNGRLFSCEPCRRSKIRCDHRQPCERCARLKKADQCKYEAAPMALPPSASSRKGSLTTTPPMSVSSSRRPSLRDRRIVSAVDILDPSAVSQALSPTYPPIRSKTARPSMPWMNSLPAYHLPTPSSSDDTVTLALNLPGESDESTFRDDSSRFLGPTSYAAVFAEGRGIPDIPPLEIRESQAVTPGEITQQRIEQGADVLVVLGNMPSYKTYIKRWFDVGEDSVIPQPLLQTWIDESWSEFGSILQNGSRDQLHALSERLFWNSKNKCAVTGHMTAKEWARAASGQQLRWEVVGIIFSLLGMIATNMGMSGDPARSTPSDRNVFANRMHDAAEMCQSFCVELGVLNDHYVCLLHENRNLVEALRGDAHHTAWQRTGDVCDAIVLAGLHRGNDVDAATPFFLSELRRRIFASAYGRDKIVASFLGRPPRLSRRYCKIVMPLDLSDEQVLLEGDELTQALVSLDLNGWNTSGKLYRATWLRVWLQHCLLREETLEIALGYADDDRSTQVEGLQTKLTEFPDTCPPVIRFPLDVVVGVAEAQVMKESDDLGNAKVTNEVDSMFAICIHAGNAHTELLLQRALLNQNQHNSQRLVLVARRLLGLALLASSKQLVLGEFQGDIVYLLAFHGLPAAGILAIELLKQEQTPVFGPEILPRSQTIQDLSVFISSLESVDPGEGNYLICHQGSQALKRVLDQVLSPKPRTNTDPFTANDMSLYFNIGNDADFLQWLDGIEWDKTDWTATLSSPSNVA